MKPCHSCGQPFTPRRPHHRYCDARDADLQASRHGGLHSHHSRLKWLDPKNILLRLVFIVLPAILLVGLGQFTSIVVTGVENVRQQTSV